MRRLPCPELVAARGALAGGDGGLSPAGGPAAPGGSALASEFCAAIADDELRVIEATPHDYRRMSELLATYSSARLQAVDACVIALAERLDLGEVATLDRRDFVMVAPRHLAKGQRLRLLPED